MTCAIRRTDFTIELDSTRVLIRPFVPDESRVIKIMARIAAQSDAEVEEHLDKIRRDFSNRHIEVEATFLKRYEQIKHMQVLDGELSEARKMLVGSYFTSEYSLESAALFNPSMVMHPDQSNVSEGSVRFVMSLRAVGEGHISSVAFRGGVVDLNAHIELEPSTSFVGTPEFIVDKEFKKDVLFDKLAEMGHVNEYADLLMEVLDDRFTMEELESGIHTIHNRHPRLVHQHDSTRQNLISLAQSNYDVRFKKEIPLAGRVLFPLSPSEKNGIEDARFVRFIDDDGDVLYYGTATAWDGVEMMPQLIETRDFQHFKIRTLNGECAYNKGMALFPRKIGGKFVMVSRQDNENIFLMESEHIQFWRRARMIIKPKYPWEFYQMGNSGSPIEIDEGWLLFTHGVGAMRRYAIGAALLDKDNPYKVLGRTVEPILMPNENEREGYVPNVVYSCGAMRHNNNIYLPYAMADQATRMAVIDLPGLLKLLK